MLSFIVLAVAFGCDGKGGPRGADSGEVDTDLSDADGDADADDGADSDNGGWTDHGENEAGTDPNHQYDHAYTGGWPIDSCRYDQDPTGDLPMAVGDVVEDFSFENDQY
jgi:hypothetical protein